MNERLRARSGKGYVLGALLGTLLGIILILSHGPPVDAAQITLAWNPPAIGTVDGYLVFSRLEGESYDYSKPAWEGLANTCNLSDVQDATTYFVVRAYNSSGESADSNEAVYEAATSSPPGTSTATASSGGGGGGAGCFIASTAHECTGEYRPLVLILGIALCLVLVGHLMGIRK